MAAAALGAIIATQAVSAQEPKYGGTLTISPYYLSLLPRDFGVVVGSRRLELEGVD